MIKDENPHYWSEYNNLQRAKHALLKKYLDGWFPKLCLQSRKLKRNSKILYFDTHSGCGKHLSGQPGSPLVALESFLSRKDLSVLLENAEVEFVFVEGNEGNYNKLVEEIKKFEPFPQKLSVKPILNDSMSELERLLSEVKERQLNFFPSLFFVDPYGFSVKGNLLFEFLQFSGSEIFMNFMWRYIHMAVRNKKKTKQYENLTLFFGDEQWKQLAQESNFNSASIKACSIIQANSKSKWLSQVHMLGDNKITEYILVHLTNHDKGRILFKESMRKICPNGDFRVPKHDPHNQMFLFEKEPDLQPLEDWVITQIESLYQTKEDLKIKLIGEDWIDADLNKALKSLIKSGKIEIVPKEEKFRAQQNHKFTLTSQTGFL